MQAAGPVALHCCIALLAHVLFPSAHDLRPLAGAQEAGRLLDARLPIPAYGQLLRLSQAFNLLDARGAVGVTERATCFATMRGLARRVARGPLS